MAARSCCTRRNIDGSSVHVKNFELHDSLSLYVRFDILNVFDWYNFADYKTNYGSSGTLPANPVTYNTMGNIFGVPRTFKAQVGMRF